MSRKDYVKLAETIRTAPIAMADRHHMATSWADVFERDNPRFDRKRFLTACGCNLLIVFN